MSLSFTQKVLKIVSQIPKGKTCTYQQVAQEAGSPRAYRAVGNILHKNHNPAIPCHRVICANGTLGGYNKGRNKKQALLKKEGAITS